MNLANLSRTPAFDLMCLILLCANKCVLFSLLDKSKFGAVWGQAPQVFAWALPFVHCAILYWKRGKGRSSYQLDKVAAELTFKDQLALTSTKTSAQAVVLTWICCTKIKLFWGSGHLWLCHRNSGAEQVKKPDVGMGEAAVEEPWSQLRCCLQHLQSGSCLAGIRSFLKPAHGYMAASSTIRVSHAFVRANAPAISRKIPIWFFRTISFKFLRYVSVAKYYRK